MATGWVEPMVPRSSKALVAALTTVETLRALDWPGVGARKPVPKEPRRAKASVTCKWVANLKLVVLPKPSKSSQRKAPPMRQFSVAFTSMSR